MAYLVDLVEKYPNFRSRLLHAHDHNVPQTSCSCGTICDGDKCVCAKAQTFCLSCNCWENCWRRLPHCECDGPCSDKKFCTCLRYNRECSDRCKHGDDNCTNNAIRSGRVASTYIAPSAIHGMGCFNEQKILKRVFVNEYKGRRKHDRELKSNAVFEINPGDYFPSTLPGNIRYLPFTRFIDRRKRWW